MGAPLEVALKRNKKKPKPILGVSVRPNSCRRGTLSTPAWAWRWTRWRSCVLGKMCLSVPALGILSDLGKTKRRWFQRFCGLNSLVGPRVFSPTGRPDRDRVRSVDRSAPSVSRQAPPTRPRPMGYMLCLHWLAFVSAVVALLRAAQNHT